MDHGQTCRITKAIDETSTLESLRYDQTVQLILRFLVATGTLNKLPGNNPVQKEGPAKMFTDPNTPALLSPIYAYTGNSPAQVGTVIVPPASGPAAASSVRPSSPTSAIGASTTLMSRSLSSVAFSPSSSAGVVLSSDMPVSSKPVVTVIPSFIPSPAVPSVSVVPPALIPHSAGNMTSTTVRSSLPSPSDVDEEDCEEEDDIGADVTTQSALPASTNTAASPITSSAHSTSVPVSSASNAASQSTLVPAQGSTDINDEDCEEEEDDDETDGSTSAPPPSSGSGSNDPKPVFVSSVQHTPTTTAVSAPSTSAGNFLPVASVSTAHPTCATGKFRHKRLREQKAQPEKRSFHYSRSFHDRFVRSHHARVF